MKDDLSYIIVQEVLPMAEYLERKVNEKIEQGYEPLGGPILMPDKRLIQAMRKREQPKRWIGGPR